MSSQTSHSHTPTAYSPATEYLADTLLTALIKCRRTGAAKPRWSGSARIHDPAAAAAAAFDIEVQALLDGSDDLRGALDAACQLDPAGHYDPAARAHFVEMLEHELQITPLDVRGVLEALTGLGGQGSLTGTAAERNLSSRAPASDHGLAHLRSRWGHRVRRVLVPLLLLNSIIAAALAVGPGVQVLLGATLPTAGAMEFALSVFAVWALTFIPGWLLVRFLDRRAGALWDEYVIHLHRLGVDRPGSLPEPPGTSAYYVAWRDDGGLARRGMRNIYQEKFDAYYGKSVSRVTVNADRPVKSEALFPVFLCTAVLAAGWTAIFYDPALSFGGPSSAGSPATTWTVLTFAFMGAYLYFLQTLMRRYFQADLRAGAYVSGYIRIVSALIVAAVLQATLFPQMPAEAAMAIAFVIGWFPDVGLKWLLRFASRRLRGAVPSLDPAYPLNRLDGLSVWYESRLLEEGIEDLQNLATAKLVDVLLHTRVPVARLVDWVDQAALLIHLPAEPAYADQKGFTSKTKADHAARSGEGHRRAALRRCGIRSATSLLRALHPGRDVAERTRLLRQLEADNFPRAAVESLYRVLDADPRLAVVMNWQEGDADPRMPLGVGPLRPVP